MKNKSINMLIVAFVLLAAFAIVITVYIFQAREDFDNDITVSENGVTEAIFEERSLKLVPTEKKELEVNLFCKASGEYHVTLDFIESANGEMKHFVNVTVLCGGVSVYEGKLATLLDDPTEKVIFDSELYSKDPTPIIIRYEMPYETGNEAQGTTADFNVHFKINKK